MADIVRPEWQADAADGEAWQRGKTFARVATDRSRLRRLRHSARRHRKSPCPALILPASSSFLHALAPVHPSQCAPLDRSPAAHVVRVRIPVVGRRRRHPASSELVEQLSNGCFGTHASAQFRRIVANLGHYSAHVGQTQLGADFLLPANALPGGGPPAQALGAGRARRTSGSRSPAADIAPLGCSPSGAQHRRPSGAPIWPHSGVPRFP